MTTPEFLFEQRGHIALLRLNRPEQMNAFTGQMADEWNEAYRQCELDDNIRAIVLTGNGKAFCAGADMSGGSDTFDEKADMDFSSCPITPAWKMRKPVIAAMNGHAIGIGFSLALQCDFRIAADEGKYGLLQVRRGVLADGCSHWLLPRLVGMERALEVMLLGRKMSGAELVAKGLAMQSVPATDVLDTALALAEEISTHSAPLITAMAKRLVWDSSTMSLDEMERRETDWLHHTMGMPDAIEGGLAFFEQRAPNWSGSITEQWPKQK
jgi:enoyl-CoA hydratase/carnithine racemase